MENIMKLGNLIKESWGKTEEEKKAYTNEEKKKFFEAVGKFQSYGKSIYREHSLKEISEQITSLVEIASDLTLTESGDWFDSHTIKRHVESLKKNLKIFNESAKEVHVLQNRLESAYDDMGSTLSKYFDISETIDEQHDGEIK